MVLVFFIYGLAFFLLGVSIISSPKKFSTLKLAKNINCIAGFGILHGINEWLDMLLIIYPDFGMMLKPVRASIGAASFFCLLRFGSIHLMDERKNLTEFIRYGQVVLVGVWASAIVLAENKFLMSDIFMRYFIGLPGVLLTAYALYRQTPEMEKGKHINAALNLKISAAGFLAYGVLTGIVVSEADFLPASIINYRTFSDAIGVPVQVFRALCAVVATYGMVMTLRIFEWERQKALLDNLEVLKSHKEQLEFTVSKRTEMLRELNRGLEDEIKERIRAEADIKSAYEEKKVLLREIQHRVKNNMQVFISLMRLQAGYIKDAKCAAMFIESQNRIESLNFIYEKLFESENIGSLRFSDYVRRLASLLYRTYEVDINKIRFVADIGDIKIGIDTAVPCGFILNELLSNSLRHGVRGMDTGEIKVTMRATEPDRFVLTVSDNGRGLPEGFSLDSIDTLGLVFVKTMAENQLKGRFSVSSNGGTESMVEFSEIKYSKRF